MLQLVQVSGARPLSERWTKRPGRQAVLASANPTRCFRKFDAPIPFEGDTPYRHPYSPFTSPPSTAIDSPVM